MFCQNCGKEVGDSKFCSGCGRAMIQKKKKAKWPIFVVLGILLVCIGLVVAWAVTKGNEDDAVKEVLEETVKNDVKENDVQEQVESNNTTSKAEEDDSSSENVDVTEEPITIEYLLKNENSVELGSPERALNQEEIYANLTYAPQMFYGDYCMLGQEEAVEAWAQEMDYMDFDGDQITTIPYEWKAGPESMGWIISRVKDKNWVAVNFVSDKGDLVTVQCEYKVKGDKVILNPVNWNYDREMAEAYRTAGMNVKVDESTGEIALDSAILFGVDEYAVSDAGKEFLEQFIGIYTSVVFSDTYKNFVSKIMVEGHTDTSGSYEMNEELSGKRAESVRDYCVEVVGDSSLADILQAVGYSYNKPIYDAEGNVDMEASRRVSFRFMINLDN